MRKTLFLLIAFFSISQVWSQDGFVKPDIKILAGLLNNPQGLAGEVTTVKRAGDKEWCTLRADYHSVYPVTLKQMKAVITDYGNYPKVFNKVRTSTADYKPEGVYQNQVVVVSVVGIENINKFTVLLTEKNWTEPSRTLIRWTQAWTDGSIDRLSGGWFLEEFKISGKTFTYVRYQTQSEVPKNVIGQDGIMGMFLDGEIKDLLNSVGRAAVSR